ncbi:MBL fold metallo-hydrolase [Desulfobulbus alkaliphilus]|uniref:MBL fold metallo-hydrolase n=1 Tax=Desulfobulbus alkaliphilus TaxID=869814 RepID=UPI0019643AAF|nr:MBL fold metallo-hydrolase [Desulfobulbus alkaliphilus]MBM9538108.1 MBL fold metallo-hydrolase [Desulfobulbus alkaliphilus]
MNLKRILPIFLLTALQVSCAPQYYQGPVTDHFDGVRFANPGSPMDKNYFDLLKWMVNRDKQPWPPYRELEYTDKPPALVEGDLLRVSFVGHVTLLLQTQGLNILTDPVWSDRASPFSWAGPRRVYPPGIRFEDLPPVDLVLISHNHYDHLDLATIATIWHRDQPRIIVPLGNDTIIHARIPEAVVEAYDWGDRVEVAPEVTVYLEPMHHWSARGLFDRNRALWAAFVITTPGGNLYFVGDSGYGEGKNFRAAREKFGTFRLAVLPIGSYEPRWFMGSNHMNPEEAVLAYQLLGAPLTIPIHYNTFQLTDTGYEAPLRDLQTAMEEYQVPEGRFRAMKVGEHWWVP